MQHGLTPQMVCFERRLVSGNWRLVTHGDPVAAGVFYHTESAPEYVCRLAYPSHYMVFAQVETGGQTTRLELKNPTAGLVWASRQWARSTFAQLNTLTHGSNMTADPTWTVLTREFMPFMHAGAQWLTQTTTENQFLRLEATSGIPFGNQPLILAVWRLHDYQQSTTGQRNALLGIPVIGSGGSIVTPLDVAPDLFWSPVKNANRYRVTANAGTVNAVVQHNSFDFYQNDPSSANQVFGGVFTHEVVLRIQSIPGESVTGSIRITIRRTNLSIVAQSVISYEPTLQTYTFPVSAGVRLASIELDQIDAADRFEFEWECNVTN